ncbi:ABC transporter permease subunit [Halomarina oriensis]|uniref:ABC transporter permease subunit n=2 Tax=Halomarina oriensis TaxID=671145 RepID=A0A6B0GJ53_9EURY|nr:iron ABC transporter permease [Halomarina oriensis]MWG34862.1 ABC transporter permease subunit [Halomarina oriensis]
MLYYPVASVLVEAVTDDGRPTLTPVLTVLTDPFYTGALASVLAAPGTLLAGLVAWAASGFAWPGFGLVGFTAWQALLSTVASVALGLPGAYVLARFEFRGRETVRSLTAVPFVLPSIMVAVGFVATFGIQGTVSDAFAAVGLSRFSLVFTLELVVLAHAFYNAPLVVRIVSAAAERLDTRTLEVARASGASRWRATWDVLVPQLVPALGTAALLTFVFTFQSFAIVLALGGLELATVEVWVFSLVRSFDLQEAAALAAVEAAISLALTYAYLRYEAQQARSTSGPTLDRIRFGEASPLARRAVGAYGLLAFVVFGLPLVSMVAESLFGPNGLTLRYYRFLVEQQATAASFQTRPLTAVRNSLVFGAGTLVVAVPLGVTVSLLTARGGRLAQVGGTLAFVPFAVSGVVVGLGLLQSLVFGTVVFGHRIVVTGAVAIVAAHAVGAYPFVTRSVSPLLARLDPSLPEVARASGASRLRALWDVELPLVAGGVLAGAAFAFAISVGEFDATVILAENSGSYTMPVAVERYLSERSLGPPSAMGTVLLVVTAASFVVIDRLGGAFDG